MMTVSRREENVIGGRAVVKNTCEGSRCDAKAKYSAWSCSFESGWSLVPLIFSWRHRRCGCHIDN